MEVMEDGNLMDKVHILIQRDMEYYKDKQSILQETICQGIIGGRLDFPRSASFASMKLVLWWEEEYVAAFKRPSGFIPDVKGEDGINSDLDCGGIVKDSDPGKFVGLICKSAEQLLEHLHILTQEALDHADLTVLTGTIGAAALLKNCLWYFVQTIEDKKSSNAEQLQNGYKKYHEMCEALAERLLDLHSRLLSLYILQDAECLDWENEKPFFESERGSYTVQMWWLYMQGTKEDLWNTVPPKMAQRVFAGVLNESLTILTVRYTQSVPSKVRSKLLTVDISNLLLCSAQLLPSICDTAKDLIGFAYTNTNNKILRDIHTKCQELFVCLLLRGAPLDELHKVFKLGLDNVELFKSKNPGPALWIVFSLPNIFDGCPKRINTMRDLNDEVAIALELMVLLAQPQPNWALLLKVLCMRHSKILRTIFRLSIGNYSGEMQKVPVEETDCGSFLCNADGTCRNVHVSSNNLTNKHHYDLVLASTEVALHTGNVEDFDEILVQVVTKREGWAKCFERRHVWNQIRPPWYEALVNLVSPLLPVTSETVINALQTDASMYQAMGVILACFSQFWDCVHPSLTRITTLLQDFIPTDVVPLHRSCLLQVLVSALYSHLLNKSEKVKKEVKFADRPNQGSVASFDGKRSGSEAISLAIAEALCGIDEDNKHTHQIDELLDQAKSFRRDSEFFNDGCERVESNTQMAEILVSDVLITSSGKHSLKALYNFIKCNSEWIYQELDVSENYDKIEPNKAIQSTNKLLHTMFHIRYKPFDQLLTGDWQPKWSNLLQIPMGLSMERVWMQLSPRWEFKVGSSSSELISHDLHIINTLTSLFKQ